MILKGKATITFDRSTGKATGEILVDDGQTYIVIGERGLEPKLIKLIHMDKCHDVPVQINGFDGLIPVGGKYPRATLVYLLEKQ